MSYQNSFNSNSYSYLNVTNNTDFKNSSVRQRKLSDFDNKNRDYQGIKKNNDDTNFLRSTMGSFKSKPNRELFASQVTQNKKKPQFSLRNTTGNLAELIKKMDFDKQIKQQESVLSKKYAQITPNKDSFKKDRNTTNYIESRPISQYEYSDSKKQTSSRPNVDQILNKMKRQKQLDQQIKRLKAEKQMKAKYSKSTSSLYNLLNTTEITPTTSSIKPKQVYNKNPQDPYGSARKVNQTYGGEGYKFSEDKKYDYDFSKKSKVDYSTFTPKRQYDFEKKYDTNFSKKYDTDVKVEYDWRKKQNNTLSFLNKQDKPNNIQEKSYNIQDKLYNKNDKSHSPINKTPTQTDKKYTTQASQKSPQFLKRNVQKSPIQASKKEKSDPFAKYFSSTSDKGQKFDCKVTIKDFKLGKSLGQGKFGTVYQAIHKQTNSLFALKKVPKSMIKSHYMIDQFILQVKLQTFMNHQNLLALHGFFHDSENIYLILDYMEQGTLYSILKKTKKLQMSDAAKKIKQISKGIIYMHQNGIAHRDLKPQNVVMSYGSCKLCDFGWSTICDERRKTYCGTFDYAAPQILQGTQYDMSVDLWCLGVLAYQLLVGKAPFYHIKKQQTKKKILNVQSQPITFPLDFPKDAIDFIEGLLKKDPQQRTKIQNLLNHPFLQKV